MAKNEKDLRIQKEKAESVDKKSNVLSEEELEQISGGVVGVAQYVNMQEHEKLKAQQAAKQGGG